MQENLTLDSDSTHCRRSQLFFKCCMKPTRGQRREVSIQKLFQHVFVILSLFFYCFPIQIYTQFMQNFRYKTPINATGIMVATMFPNIGSGSASNTRKHEGISCDLFGNLFIENDSSSWDFREYHIQQTDIYSSHL